MVLAPYYREYDLPWDGDLESSQRFRKILRVLLIVLAIFGILFPLLPRPQHTIAEEVPERLARVMTQTPKPPAPPPPPVPKPQKKPNQVKDQLADLRDIMDLKPLETKNLSGAVGADAHAERSLITSKVGAGSGGITSANSSRGFGSGAGSLTGHETTAVNSGIVASGLNAK